MKQKINNGIIYVGGVFFVALGVVGLILPFLHGILFVILGIYILSLRSPKMKALLEKIFARFPTIHKAALLSGRKAQKIGQRLNLL